MTLLERTLGRPIDKPPGGRGNWWNRGNNASKNQHVGVIHTPLNFHFSSSGIACCVFLCKSATHSSRSQ